MTINYRWSKEEIEYLIKNMGKINISVVALNLNRSRYAVYQKSRAIGVYQQNKKKIKNFRD